jgi:hypothetical protein
LLDIENSETSKRDAMNVEGNSITIGSFHAGGIVFYLDEKNQSGLVCAPSDQRDSDDDFVKWGCRGLNIETRDEIGSGRSNTNLIMNVCDNRPIAASLCADLKLNGYDDWILPSRNELTLMYQNLKVQGIGDFLGFWYWSSSQMNFLDAWMVNFEFGAAKSKHKSHVCNVRAVRSFNFSTI